MIMLRDDITTMKQKQKPLLMILCRPASCQYGAKIKLTRLKQGQWQQRLLQQMQAPVRASMHPLTLPF